MTPRRAWLPAALLCVGLLAGCTNDVGSSGNQGYVAGKGVITTVATADRKQPGDVSGTSIDGEPLDDEAFVRAFNDVAPYTHLVDAGQEHPLSFFETIVAMAYAAFADAPVDVAVVEVGMGGTWDATNVIDADVAVVLPVAVDHAKYLGEDAVAIAAARSASVVM